MPVRRPDSDARSAGAVSLLTFGLMLRRLTAVLLLVYLTPMASEVAEWAVHFVVRGDFAHATGHRDAFGDDEHGCTPLFHGCECHASAATTGARIAFNVEVPSAGWAASDLTGRPAKEGEPPPHRPPIA